MVNMVILLAILLQVTGVVSVHLEPQSLAVLLGSRAEFNCSTTAPWVIMSWLLNSRVVMTISASHGIFSNSDSFTAINHSTDRTTEWELVFWNVTQNSVGNVTCDLQNTEKQTATLSVQESGTVTITGGNLSVMKGEKLLFQCQAFDWLPEPHVTWALGGKVVNEQSYITTSMATAEGLFNSTSILQVLALDSTSVECQASVPALPSPKSSAVFITVVADVWGEEQKLLIVVTVLLSAVLLLLLLILAITYCYRKRRGYSRRQEDTRYLSQPDEKWAVGWRSEKPVDQAGQAKVNPGHTSSENPGVSQSELRSGHGQTISISAHQEPDVTNWSNHPICQSNMLARNLNTNGTKRVGCATIV